MYQKILDLTELISIQLKMRDKLFSGVWDREMTYDKYDAAEYGFDCFKEN